MSSKSKLGVWFPTPKQERVFNEYLNGQNVYVSGKGGSGKTKVAASILVNAKKRQVPYIYYTYNTLSKDLNKGVKWKWRNIKLIVVDEVSIKNKDIISLVQLIDSRGRNSQNLNMNFGGIKVIMFHCSNRLPSFKTCVNKVGACNKNCLSCLFPPESRIKL